MATGRQDAISECNGNQGPWGLASLACFALPPALPAVVVALGNVPIMCQEPPLTGTCSSPPCLQAGACPPPTSARCGKTLVRFRHLPPCPGTAPGPRGAPACPAADKPIWGVPGSGQGARPAVVPSSPAASAESCGLDARTAGKVGQVCLGQGRESVCRFITWQPRRGRAPGRASPGGRELGPISEL